VTFRIEIAPSAQADMNAHAERAFPEECCGTLLGHDRDDGVREVTRVLPVENTKDENRKRRYLIDPRALLAAEKEARAAGLDVVGIYHSHPNHPSRASDFDRDHAMPFWSYVIISCMEGVTAQVQSWRLRDDRSAFDEETIG
jgi:proteasome lid subunit RPN8/RPN11